MVTKQFLLLLLKTNVQNVGNVFKTFLLLLQEQNSDKLVLGEKKTLKFWWFLGQFHFWKKCVYSGLVAGNIFWILNICGQQQNIGDISVFSWENFVAIFLSTDAFLLYKKRLKCLTVENFCLIYYWIFRSFAHSFVSDAKWTTTNKFKQAKKNYSKLTAMWIIQ